MFVNPFLGSCTVAWFMAFILTVETLIIATNTIDHSLLIGGRQMRNLSTVVWTLRVASLQVYKSFFNELLLLRKLVFGDASGLVGVLDFDGAVRMCGATCIECVESAVIDFADEILSHAAQTNFVSTGKFVNIFVKVVQADGADVFVQVGVLFLVLDAHEFEKTRLVFEEQILEGGLVPVKLEQQHVGDVLVDPQQFDHAGHHFGHVPENVGVVNYKIVIGFFELLH